MGGLSLGKRSSMFSGALEGELLFNSQAPLETIARSASSKEVASGHGAWLSQRTSGGGIFSVREKAPLSRKYWTCCCIRHSCQGSSPTSSQFCVGMGAWETLMWGPGVAKGERSNREPTSE